MIQKVYEGKENLISLKESLDNKQVKNIFLVSGKQSYSKSFARDLLKPILKNYKTIRFYEFEENPKVEDIKKGLLLFRENECQAIIAIGGGSVIDTAKLINAYQSDNNEIEPHIKSNTIGVKTVPLYVIPTTSGSGSEATHFAVIYFNKIKYSVASDTLLPLEVYLIPELTYSTSSYLTAVTGLDAFCQSIESWWSTNSTEESIGYSKEALSLIWENLPNAVLNDKNAKSLLMRGAHLAGKAINIAKTTAPHALSYGFTSHFGLPHGHSVSLFMPAFINLHQNANENDCNDNRGINWIKDVIRHISHVIGTSPEDTGWKILQFYRQCGITINYNSLNISYDDFTLALSNFNQERLNNNPIKVNKSFLSNLYYSKYNHD